MSRVFAHGFGAVSPAGWGVPDLTAALEIGLPLPTQEMARPGWDRSLRVRNVPPPATRPAFLVHPRLRRASVMAQHTVAAALEALGDDAGRAQAGELRLAVIVSMLAGSVAYTRRFYEEVLRDPPTASPLIFPETVFNAPASHLAAFLGTTAINYTLVGDEGSFLQGLALAASWLDDGLADACIVVGVEEMDWIVADALRLFRRGLIYSSGAGAVYLKNDTGPVELAAVTDSFLFTQEQRRADAARKMRAQLPAGSPDELLCESDTSQAIWGDWAGRRLALKGIFGEAFTALAAWQCVAAGDAVRRRKFKAANVSIIGADQQAIGARLVNPDIF
ncbi:MAG: beta-ketoacyl synthase N-terminal-like domain-containing protein [Verrucomicrobiota bacterium]|jgi:hypothetical protein